MHGVNKSTVPRSANQDSRSLVEPNLHRSRPEGEDYYKRKYAVFDVRLQKVAEVGLRYCCVPAISGSELGSWRKWKLFQGTCWLCLLHGGGMGRGEM